MKYCDKCGNQLLDEAVMCPKCGCDIGKQNQHNEEKRAKEIGLGTLGILIGISTVFLVIFLAMYQMNH